MKTKTFVLHNGLVTDSKTHKTVKVRETTLDDSLQAEEAAGDLHELRAAENLRRRVVSLGDLPGPIPLDIFRKLTAVDVALIVDACADLDAEVVEELKAGRKKAGGPAGSETPAGQENPRAGAVQ